MAPKLGQEQLNPSHRGAGLTYLLHTEEEGKEEEEEVNNDNPNTPPHQATQFNTTLTSQLNLRNNNIEDNFNNIEQSCSRIKLGAPCSFPKSDSASFNKDNQLHIGHLHHIHKATKVTMRLTLLACQRHQAAYNELEDIMTALLFTMHLVLDAHNEIWVRRHHREEAFNAFMVLENSSLTSDHHQHLINTITISSLSGQCDQVQKASHIQQPQHSGSTPRGRGHGDFKTRPYNSNTTSRGHGASTGAHHN